MDHHHGNHVTSDVRPEVSYINKELIITLKDKHGKIPELKMSHEKEMHLIVISSDLRNYHHLHPEEKGDGKYSQVINLTDGDYKVFVDISPKDLDYTVIPIEMNIGKTNKTSIDNKLVADTNLTKTINGQTVELITGKVEIDKEVTFVFDVKKVKPELYLGALGHVVMTDESGDKFIHVHPKSENETIFITQFEEPGLYKMWAEFKLDGVVIAYPFVIEVE